MNIKSNSSLNSNSKINSSTLKTVDNFEPSSINTDTQTGGLAPLLPRSAWQDQRAFLIALIKVKRSLDLAEITALVNSENL